MDHSHTTNISRPVRSLRSSSLSSWDEPGRVGTRLLRGGASDYHSDDSDDAQSHDSDDDDDYGGDGGEAMVHMVQSFGADSQSCDSVSQMSGLSRLQAWNLYLSHALSTWNARGYEFAAVSLSGRLLVFW